jgi:hypothetical protein
MNCNFEKYKSCLMEFITSLEKFQAPSASVGKLNSD